MTAPVVLVLNAGSSSIKFAALEAANDVPVLLASGQVDGIGVKPAFRARLAGEVTAGAVQRIFEDADGPRDHSAALELAMAWLSRSLEREIAVVGHRVVHGGTRFTEPVIVDDQVLSALENLVPLAPLHQPHNIACIRAAIAAFPAVPQVACFDTAFHRGHSFEADAFAIPRRYFDEGVRRYGFHGLSYEFIAHRLKAVDPAAARGKTVVAHLGNGSSLCAIDNGRSVATTMGFTALDGVPMGTRSGQIDPGVLLYLMDERKMDATALERLLYRESGLLGLSGISSDMRALEASTAPEATQAITCFTYAIRGAVARLAAALEGLDCIVFTAGIGENSPRVRAEVLAGLGFLGVDLDAAANLANGPLLTTVRSRTKAYVIATNEEAMIARHALDVLAGCAGSQAAAAISDPA
ncbi:MAG: acetate/propionate family kinase [Hyphomicrobiales bacterium]